MKYKEVHMAEGEGAEDDHPLSGEETEEGLKTGLHVSARSFGEASHGLSRGIHRGTFFLY